jgi:uncharacterized protein (DUF2235 family)
MSKRIIFCSDGTWDSASNQTNVYKLYKACLVTAGQMPFYDDGVGANTLPLQKVLGGAFGLGLFQKIKDGYKKIAHVYEQDDEIFLFGFSRGAYTARSLAGMIAACGLPTANFTDDLVETAFEAYRKKDQRVQLLDKLKSCNLYPAKIKMVGVWDTVGSLGIPSLFGAVEPVVYGFLDTSLNPKVENAYHALAIDEMRMEFPPTLWTSAPAPGQTLEQVWFCGVHSDVGGGEPADGTSSTALSDIPLSWMMDKASALGLQFDNEVRAQYEVPLDTAYAMSKLHTSWSVLKGIPKRRTINKNATLANSVAIRCLNDAAFRPENLQFVNGALATEYQILQILKQPAAAAS